MSAIDLNAWTDAESDPQRQIFRQAVHLILRGIAQSEELSPIMVMKGGILLAVHYESQRFTTDIDFSTSQRYQEIEVERLLEMMRAALDPVDADNEYGLALRLQSYEIKPPNRPNVSFPTLKMRIGYAPRRDRNLMKRLEVLQVPHTVQVDYSFNEWASGTEMQSLDGGRLIMYGFHDLIAEKLRSILQQPVRGRARYQDIYDLVLLLDGEEFSDKARREILEKLHSASEGRDLSLHREAMRDPAVIEWSEKEYSQLNALLDVEPPAFDVAYTSVRDFFESLPW